MDTDNVTGDDFEAGRKMLANVLEAIPKTGAFRRLQSGAWVKSIAFHVDRETLAVKVVLDRQGTGDITIDFDEL